MRFGGHETFAVREGWLHKGVKLVAEYPERVDDKYVADWLGVGRNMAKSIKHWLVACGLTERPFIANTRKRGAMQLTRLGRIVFEHDPYFLEKGTWGALHVNLVNNQEHAVTWTWFFNHFLNTRFERATCVEALRRYLTIQEKRQPSLRTLQRDVACLLAAYSKVIPPIETDPEDAAESPFRDLGLLVHFRDSGAFGRQSLRPESLPAELLPYAIAMAESGFQGYGEFIEIGVREACLMPSGPGRCFNLDLENFHELASRAETVLGSDQLQLVTLAGERLIRLRGSAAEDWLLQYYARLGAKDAA